jgi:hypothetical protein
MGNAAFRIINMTAVGLVVLGSGWFAGQAFDVVVVNSTVVALVVLVLVARVGGGLVHLWGHRVDSIWFDGTRVSFRNAGLLGSGSIDSFPLSEVRSIEASAEYLRVGRTQAARSSRWLVGTRSESMRASEALGVLLPSQSRPS